MCKSETVFAIKLDIFKNLSLQFFKIGGVMVSKLDTSEFESHWVPHSFGLVPHRSKRAS